MNECPCGSGEFKEAQYDGRGIFLCYTCDQCHASKMRGYNPVVLGYYTEDDVECAIEPLD